MCMYVCICMCIYIYVCMGELGFRITLSNLSTQINENRLIVIKSFSLEKNQFNEGRHTTL